MFGYMLPETGFPPSNEYGLFPGSDGQSLVIPETINGTA
jgi:hypothetical protein